MEQASVRALLTGVSDELLQVKIYKLDEYQDFTVGLLRLLINSLTFPVPLTCFVKRQAEKAVARELKLIQNVSGDKLVNEEITPRSPSTDRFH